MTIVCCNNTNPNGRRVYYTNRKGHPIDPTKTVVMGIGAPTGLHGLAQFLSENIYNTSNHRGALTVHCYDDRRTEGDLLRAENRNDAEAIIRAYGLDEKPAAVNDWLFPVLGDDESAESFWNRAADEMRHAGVTRVVVSHPLGKRVEYSE